MSRATGIFTITSWKPTTTLQLQISFQGLLTSHVNQVLQSAVHLYWYRTRLVAPPPQDLPMKFYYAPIPPTEIESTSDGCFEYIPACYNLVYLWDSTRLGLGRIFLPDVISFLSSGSTPVFGSPSWLSWLLLITVQCRHKSAPGHGEWYSTCMFL